MINLLTGGPGAGKTCFIVGEIKAYVAAGRPVFQHGIPELTLPHTRVYCRDSLCTVCGTRPEDALYADEWPSFLPNGAVLIVDEVQKIWRPRSSKSRDIPLGLAALETSRHRGVDMWFMTQSPSLLDVHARRMVTRHLHIRNQFGGRRLFEWPETQVDINKTFTAKDNKPYTLNKAHFGLYKSADIHTVQKRSIPRKFILIAVALVLMVGFVGYRFSTNGIFSGGEVVTDSPSLVASGQGEEEGGNSARGRASPPPVSSSGGFFQGSELVASDPFDRVAVDPLLPESAPAYSHLVEVVDYPRIAGCARNASKGTCNCYLQSYPLTRVAVSGQFCVNYLDNPPFNPYVVHGGSVNGSLGR